MCWQRHDRSDWGNAEASWPRATRGDRGRTTVARPPDVRVSDSDRHAVVDDLQRHTADGRLTLDEFEERVDEALRARTGADLDVALRDLPSVAPTSPRRARRPVAPTTGLHRGLHRRRAPDHRAVVGAHPGRVLPPRRLRRARPSPGGAPARRTRRVDHLRLTSSGDLAPTGAPPQGPRVQAPTRPPAPGSDPEVRRTSDRPVRCSGRVRCSAAFPLRCRERCRHAAGGRFVRWACALRGPRPAAGDRWRRAVGRRGCRAAPRRGASAAGAGDAAG